MENQNLLGRLKDYLPDRETAKTLLIRGVITVTAILIYINLNRSERREEIIEEIITAKKADGTLTLEDEQTLRASLKERLEKEQCTLAPEDGTEAVVVDVQKSCYRHTYNALTEDYQERRECCF